MAVGDKTGKISVCFLCLRNVEETQGLNGYNNGDLDLLKRFLCLSLELPQAVVGDLLCSNVRVATTGAGQGQYQGHGENLLCESCVKEVRATCELYRDLARKLKELERILEKSTEAFSETSSVNLHEKVARQLSGNGEGGGDQVKRLRNLLASKLHKRGRKLAGGEDEDESWTLKKSQPMSKSNLNHDNAEVTEDGAFDFENEENAILNVVNPVKVEMDDDNNDDDYLDADSDDGQTTAMGTKTKIKDSAPVVIGWSSSGQSSDDDVDINDDDDDIKKRPFQRLRCNDPFETIEAIADHVDVCRDTRDKPMEVERQTKPKPEKAQKKRFTKKSKVGNTLKRAKLEGGDGYQQKKCRFCGKEFSRWLHVICHERTHTGEKPFGCGKCRRKFNTRYNCKRHELKCKGGAKAKISDGDDDDNDNGNSIFQQIPGHVEEIDDGIDADADSASQRIKRR